MSSTGGTFEHGVRSDANGATVTNSYTQIGKMANVTDARGGQVAYTYDARALVATRTDAMGAVASVTQRDGMGNLLASGDRKGQALSMTFDPLNRPLTASYADGSTVSWTWDLTGRLTQLQDSVGGTVARVYDGLDRITNETTPRGTKSYTYDAAGRRLIMQAAYDFPDHREVQLRSPIKNVVLFRAEQADQHSPSFHGSWSGLPRREALNSSGSVEPSVKRWHD
jgi:YD repeat-containing protein